MTDLQRELAPLPPPHPADRVVATATARPSGGTWVLLASALTVVLGALLPWALVSARLGRGVSRTITGTESNGAITIVLGVLVGLAAVIAYTRSGPSWWVAAVAIVAGAMTSLVAFVEVLDVHRLDNGSRLAGLIDVSVGTGLWLTLAGGVTAALGGLLVLRHR